MEKKKKKNTTCKWTSASGLMSWNAISNSSLKMQSFNKMRKIEDNLYLINHSLSFPFAVDDLAKNTSVHYFQAEFFIFTVFHKDKASTYKYACMLGPNAEVMQSSRAQFLQVHLENALQTTPHKWACQKGQPKGQPACSTGCLLLLVPLPFSSQTRWPGNWIYCRLY